MTLLHLFLIHRYKAASVHYLTPTEDNQPPDRADGRRAGLFSAVHDEVGEIIVADVDSGAIRELVATDSAALSALIAVG